MAETEQLYLELVGLVREAETLASCGHLLGWDEQTCLPKKGAPHRAEQSGLLQGLTHERRTQPRIGELLGELQGRYQPGDLSEEAVNVRGIARNYARNTKLPRRLVEELSRTATLGQKAWVDARDYAEFHRFQSYFEKMVSLKREEASIVGAASGNLYDALLDEYEPEITSTEIQQLFGPLRTELVKLLHQIQASPVQPTTEIIERHYPMGPQRVFAEGAAHSIGFDFERGRIDESAHPFCSGNGPDDCRLTTRFHSHMFNMAFFGVLHEAGHGIYEQGLKTEAFGLPAGTAVSLGIHESQSRLWENFVGRGRPFWSYFYPHAQRAFPTALHNVPLDDFYQAINVVRPSFIRVEADEVTYNLHIMLRFELEQKLVSGELQVADVPAAWNEAFERDFGMRPPTDAQGCLQDVHWSAGLLGYFPTYTLGNMCAAQFYEAAEREIGPLTPLFEQGEFKVLKKWLNEKIHSEGQRYTTMQLVERVSAAPLSHASLVAHLRGKFSEVYQLPG